MADPKDSLAGLSIDVDMAPLHDLIYRLALYYRLKGQNEIKTRMQPEYSSFVRQKMSDKIKKKRKFN